jgi:hypothetical protein
MEIAFFTCLGVNSVLIVTLLAHTRARVFGIFANSALNPLMVFCLLAIIFNLDFYLTWSSPFIGFEEFVSSIPSTTVVEAYEVYTVLFIGTFLGLMVAIIQWSDRPMVPTPIDFSSGPDAAAQKSAAIVTLIMCCATVVNLPVYLSYNLTEAVYVVYAREHTFATLLTWLVPPTVAVFVAYHRAALGIAISLAAASFLYVAADVRGFVLLVISVPVIRYATYKRISPLWFTVFFPVLGVFLAVFRYLFREIGKFASYADFINHEGGYIRMFFGGEEGVSFAKVFTMMYNFTPPVPTGMFDSFIALLALPMPRFLYPDKPLGPSAIFTQYVSPSRWETTQSESLITGYGDMYWHFGFAAVLVLFAIAYVWLWLCIRVINTSRQSMVMYIPLLNFGMFDFVRGDVFNVGLVLWPALIMIVAFRFFCKVFRRKASQRTQIGFQGASDWGDDAEHIDGLGGG